MLYAQFWDKTHEIPMEDEKKVIRDLKFQEDLKVIQHFDNLYTQFQNTEPEKPKKKKLQRSDSDSSQEETNDIMDILNKELEKINSMGKVPLRTTKKLNPFAKAQADFKKTRVISKRLNTLSIFVKKDSDNTRQQEMIFNDSEKNEHGNKQSKNKARK